MTARKKICFVSLNMYPLLNPECGIPFSGGAEVQQCLIAKELGKLGYDISVITLDHGQPDGSMLGDVHVFNAYRQESGIKGVRFFHPRLTGIWSGLHRANADIYYQRTAGMITGVVGAYCRLYGKKFIYAGASDLNFALGRHGLPYYRDVLLYEWGLKRADKVIVQNEAQKELLRCNYGIEGLLIHNIGEASGMKGCWESKKVAWVAAVSPKKMPLRFVELARKCPSIDFLLIGGSSGGYKSLWDQVSSRAAELDNIKLTGYIPCSQLNSVLKDVSVLVNTSDKEGFPNTFLEAWAMGIPTVSFVRVDAGPGINTPGMVVSDDDEMVVVIERLIADKSVWEKESMRSRQAFEKFFEFSGVKTKYVNLIETI